MVLLYMEALSWPIAFNFTQFNLVRREESMSSGASSVTSWCLCSGWGLGAPRTQHHSGKNVLKNKSKHIVLIRDHFYNSNFSQNYGLPSWQPIVTTTQIYPKYTKNMPKICPRYAEDRPNISPWFTQYMPRYAQYMLKICPKYAKSKPKICLRYAQYIANICQDMPKICLRYAQNMPKVCPRYA